MKGEPLQLRFANLVDETPGYGPHGDCHRWVGCRVRNGYGQISVNKRMEYAHRVSYELAHGVSLQRVRSGGPLVCHKCDVRDCVNPEHLFLGTHQDNVRDMHGKSRWRSREQRGEHNYMAVLTDDIVRSIRRDKRSNKLLASLYGVAEHTVYQVKARLTWKHI